MQMNTVPTTLTPAMREFLDVVARLIVLDLSQYEGGSHKDLNKPEGTSSLEDLSCLEQQCMLGTRPGCSVRRRSTIR